MTLSHRSQGVLTERADLVGLAGGPRVAWQGCLHREILNYGAEAWDEAPWSKVRTGHWTGA